ncbi:sensor histidine kinase [Parapedobacter indicus]|uniref:histidine kinase n=1 Tax=Parapedobacter indicus TaxID=1477437 RepID=A0A1I3FJF8_9SPHI|nr:histidine kinase [Parapedobacter indicus]PPL03754.1 histidine kinase [Parapedobacter indicus]SFI11349.1 Histidine kinase [Parapedobacter indicus]
MKSTKPNGRIRRLTFTMLLFMIGICYADLNAAPYHYTQILPGIDRYHAMVTQAAKDPSGMIWLLSGGQLYRYDGVNVVPFSKLYSHGLPFYEVSDFHADPWGHLWINTRNGLAIFDLRSWSFVKEDHYLSDLVGRPVASCFKLDDLFYLADGLGSLWRIDALSKHFLFQFDPNAVYDRRPVGRMLVADNEHVWLAFGDHLYEHDLQTRQTRSVAFPEGLFNRIEDLLPVHGGVLIRIYSKGYYVFDGTSFRYLNRRQFPTNDFTNWNHWSFERDDKIIVFHEDKYMEFSRDTAFRLLNADSHQLDEHILHKRLNGWQEEGDEWLICTDGGLFSVFPTKITFDFINSGSARGMIKQGNTYYFGGYGYLDALPSGGELRPYTSEPENNYYDFLKLSNDTVCIALEGDFLCYLVGGKVVPAPLHVPGNSNERFSGMAYCVVQQVADTLLVGTYNGIWKYARSSGNVYPLVCPKNGFFSRGMRVQSISYVGAGITFTTDEGYFNWRNNQFRKVYPADEAKLNIYSHTQFGDSVYLATKGRGLVVIDRMGHHARSVGAKEGLASNTVYQMMWVDSTLFLGTHEGLSMMNGNHLYNYYHTDGLPFEEFNHQAIYHDRATGELFMGGIGGYIRFHPAQLLRSTHEYIDAPLIAGTSLGMKSNRYVDAYAGKMLQDTIQLPSDAVWFSLNFARPNHYRQMYRMLFKIAPLMDAYQELPASSQINLSGMSAGNYYVSVKVQAVNDRTVEKEHTWVIHKAPAFTETLTFYMLLILIVGGTTGFILYERGRKIKGENRLRRRISRDLHDEVGGLLTGISMQTDLLRLKDDRARIESVDSIGSYSREAIQMMDDIIWTVDSRNNQQGSLSDRMKYLAGQLLEPMDIAVTFEVDQQEDRKIPQSVRQNLYLIYKEAIHNICKHARADSVYVKLHHSGAEIALVIRDNGQQGQQSRVKPPRGRSGHGKRNMQMRAEQIGGVYKAGHTATGYEVSVIVFLYTGRRWMNPLKYLIS